VYGKGLRRRRRPKVREPRNSSSRGRQVGLFSPVSGAIVPDPSNETARPTEPAAKPCEILSPFPSSSVK